jgi:hypothetical protein
LLHLTQAHKVLTGSARFIRTAAFVSAFVKMQAAAAQGRMLPDVSANLPEN